MERIVRMVGETDPGFTVYLGEMLEKSQVEESVEPLVVLMEQLNDEILCITVDGGTAGDMCGITNYYFWGDIGEVIVEKLRGLNGLNVLACHIRSR